MLLDSFDHERAIEAFLALALLQEKMVAIRTLHHALAGSGASDALLGAAVGL